MSWRINALSLAALAVIAAAPAPSVSNLDWLTGKWVAETGDGWVEEQWTDARGGMMLGTNRSGEGTQAVGYEFMRIAADDRGEIHFWGSPSGAPPVAFRLISSKGREAVFENPGHDYPTRITYRMKGDLLVGAISGPEGKSPISWTFRRAPRR